MLDMQCPILFLLTESHAVGSQCFPQRGVPGCSPPFLIWIPLMWSLECLICFDLMEKLYLPPPPFFFYLGETLVVEFQLCLCVSCPACTSVGCPTYYNLQYKVCIFRRYGYQIRPSILYVHQCSSSRSF